jgi:hypothetical protein
VRHDCGNCGTRPGVARVMPQCFDRTAATPALLRKPLANLDELLFHTLGVRALY